MIAVDTNLLVYAHRNDSPWHKVAYERVRFLAEGRAPWAIPWPCISEFLATVTHPRIYVPPTSLEGALEQVEAWLQSPSLVLLAESENSWKSLRATLKGTHVRGPQLHDARIAALCLHHGVQEFWTADRDFSRFAALTVRHPLVES